MDEAERTRTPISSLARTIITSVEDAGPVIRLFSGSKCIAEIRRHNWTLFDGEGNYFEDDVR